MSKKKQKKAKEEWAILKPKLDAARAKRGIHEVDPEDKEYVKLLSEIRINLDKPVAPAMPLYATIASASSDVAEGDPTRANRAHQDNVANKGPFEE